MIGLLNKYYSNFRHPEGLIGKFVVHKMNGKKHAALAEWTFTHVEIAKDATALDIGCGGGANVARLLEICTEGKVAGMDFAPVSVAISKSYNKEAIEQGRCKIVGGNAKLLPFFKDTIDVATAFETVYYWPSIEECLAEVLRVLKPGGQFIIANDADGIDPEGEKWAKLIGHMRIYTIDELKHLLTETGFTSVTAHHDKEHHRICVTARKPKD